MANILKLSDAASLGLHAMVYLASRAGKPSPAREIAAFHKVSEAHLAKVLQRLAKVGLVESSPGPGGGFKLVKPGNELSLLDVYAAVEGPLPEETCLLGQRVCDGGGCVLGDLLGQLNKLVRGYLTATTLDQLAFIYGGANHGQA